MAVKIFLANLKKIFTPKGFSLVEGILSICILSIIFVVTSNLFLQSFKAVKITERRAEVQRDAQTALEMITSMLAKADANTLSISRQDSFQPPYSKIEFQTTDGKTFIFYQQDNKLIKCEPSCSGTSTIIENLRLLSFSFPNTKKNNLISIAICTNSDNPGGKSQEYYISMQKIRLLNS